MKLAAKLSTFLIPNRQNINISISNSFDTLLLMRTVFTNILRQNNRLTDETECTDGWTSK
jgi:hypothetical protein